MLNNVHMSAMMCTIDDLLTKYMHMLCTIYKHMSTMDIHIFTNDVHSRCAYVHNDVYVQIDVHMYAMVCTCTFMMCVCARRGVHVHNWYAHVLILCMIYQVMA